MDPMLIMELPGFFGQQRQTRARDAQHAEHVGLHHKLPVLVLALGDGFESFRAAGIVDEHVELVRESARPLGEFVHARSRGDIQRVRVRGGCAVLHTFAGDLFKPVQPSRSEQQLCAFGCKGARRRSAEAAGSSRDQHPLVRKSRWHGDARLAFRRGRLAILICRSGTVAR